MLRFLNTGISSEPTKTNRVLVYTDIVIVGQSGVSGYSGWIPVYPSLISGYSGYSGYSGQSGYSGYSGYWEEPWNTDRRYPWAVYVPHGVSVADYLSSNSVILENDIETKEEIWNNSPHTEMVLNPRTGQMEEVAIPKERIVHPTIPDYEETVSDPAFDIKSIKRLLIDLCNAVFSSPTITAQQVEDLAVITDNFKVGVAYAADSHVCFEGSLYKVLQSHTSQADWLPPSTPSLFVKIIPSGYVTAWVQPTGAHNAYQIGDKVTYNSKEWECNTANNVWAPGVYGWTDLTPAPANNWTPGVAYAVNSVVTYVPNGLLYKCLQAHTAQVGWDPPNVPALWQLTT